MTRFFFTCGPTAWAVRGACLAAALVLAACIDLDDRIVGGSTSTESGTKISLTGRVLDTKNAGLGGIVVELSHTGLKDTTDAQGSYSLIGQRDSNVVGSASVVDTLVLTRYGMRLATLPVFKWVDNIRILQRNISAKLLSAPVAPARVEAVISGGQIPTDQPVVRGLDYSYHLNSYMGFAYLREEGNATKYYVFVRTFDATGSLLGQSLGISFNSTTGNISIPEFDAANLLNDTILIQPAGDTIHLGDNTGNQGTSYTKPFSLTGVQLSNFVSAKLLFKFVLPYGPNDVAPAKLFMNGTQFPSIAPLLPALTFNPSHWAINGDGSHDYNDTLTLDINVPKSMLISGSNVFKVENANTADDYRFTMTRIIVSSIDPTKVSAKKGRLL